MKVEKKETINDNGTCTMEKKITNHRGRWLD